MSELREQILEHVQRANYQPVKPAVIAKKLGVTGEEAQQVKKAIKRLVKEKRLAYGPSHLVFPHGQSPSQKKAAKLVADQAKAKASFQAAPSRGPPRSVIVTPIVRSVTWLGRAPATSARWKAIQSSVVLTA